MPLSTPFALVNPSLPVCSAVRSGRGCVGVALAGLLLASGKGLRGALFRRTKERVSE